MTPVKPPIDAAALDQLFLTARTYNGWLPTPVPDALIRQLYDTLKMAPTSGNCNPMRVVFVKSAEGKKKLLAGLKPANVEKTMQAPVTAVMGFDTAFYEHLDLLAPHVAKDRQANYLADPDLAQRAAFRNATLQGAYMLLAARALGLDCGPMSGILHDVLDHDFFSGGKVVSNFIMNIGYGDPASVRPRAARFAFDDVCSIV